MRKILLFLLGILILLFLICIIFFKDCRCKIFNNCPPGSPSPHVDTVIKKWVDLNVLFKDRTSQAERTAGLDAIKRYLTDTFPRNYAARDSTITFVSITSIKIDSCSCDPLFYNVTATMNLSGGSGSTGQQCKNPNDPNCVHPQGDAIATLGFNYTFKPEQQPISKNGTVVKIDPAAKKTDAIFAIIDAGIDDKLFDHSGLDGILWKGSATPPERVNFTSTGSPDDVFDATKSKHGSAVAAIAIEQFTAANAYPKLMILKVFDADENGSIFSTGCAIKFAVDHNADIINASWGYSGAPDPVLEHYIRLATKHEKPIPVIAAAGNIPVDAAATYCANPVLTSTFLDSNPFYPACFSDLDENVVTVTGMNGNLHPCFYQNYSQRYVTLAVKSDTSHNPCCGFNLPYLPERTFMTGSSFATPVISSRIQTFMTAHPTENVHSLIHRLNPHPVNIIPFAAKDYIDY